MKSSPHQQGLAQNLSHGENKALFGFKGIVSRNLDVFFI
jgi:hypothetical protein